MLAHAYSPMKGQTTHPVNHIVLSKKHSEGIGSQTEIRSRVSDVPQLLNWLWGVGVGDSRRNWRRYGLHSNVESERRPIVSDGIGVYLDLASEKITDFPDHLLAGVIHHSMVCVPRDEKS